MKNFATSKIQLGRDFTMQKLKKMVLNRHFGHYFEYAVYCSSGVRTLCWRDHDVRIKFLSTRVGES